MQRKRLWIVLSILLIGTSLFAGAQAGSLSTQRASLASNQPDILPPSGEAATLLSAAAGMAAGPRASQVVRLYYNDRAHLDAVAGELDIWEVDQKYGYAVVAVSPAEYDWLNVLGYRMEMDAEKTAMLNAPNAPLDPRYHYFDTDYINPNGNYVVDFLQDTAIAHPDLTELVDIGNAWQADHGGHLRDIWVLRITNEDPAYGDITDKPPYFLFATIHAREVAVPELAIRYIKFLTDGFEGLGGYGVDADVTWLVNHHVIYVLVMQNPDGHRVNEQDTNAFRRKNMDNDDGCPDPGTWGVDLNRNHSFFWGCCGGSSGNPCSDTYRGPSLGSEPETDAFQDYFATVMPDHNGPNGDYEIGSVTPAEAPGIFLSLHSYADMILWPWDITAGPPPNEAELQAIAHKLATINGYEPGSIGYTVDGATDDFTYGKFGVASFTFEVGPNGGACAGFFPPFGCVDGIDGMPRDFWAENRPAFLYMHKIASSPFLTVYGPDSGDLALHPAIVAPSQPTTLTAMVADQRYGSDPLQPVTAAEYFIGAPGTSGTGIPMQPVDGAWGETSEAVEGVVDTTGLSYGSHYILVHGQNEDGIWGPFTAVFVYVLEPGVAPQIEGYVIDATNGSPLAANISAGVFQADTDPATGYYSMTVLSGTYDMMAKAVNHIPITVEDITAQNYQTVRQDFTLDPICPVFEDDMENGNLGWTHGGTFDHWAITEEAANSPTHAWSDSPSSNYSNNTNAYLVSPIIDLGDYTQANLSFYHIYALETGYDFGYIEVSNDGGMSWSQVAVFDGFQNDWTQESLSLPTLAGSATARIRFRLDADGSLNYDGWHIDDVLVSGAGESCRSPSASFSTNSPVVIGQLAEFTNLSTGTEPLTFLWDFGDGLTSTETSPTHLYPNLGVYTVTLAASNLLGSQSSSQAVEIVPCTPLSSIDLTLVTTDTLYVGSPAEFTADFAPNGATTPITYTIDYGDDTPPTTAQTSDDPLTLVYTYTQPGNFNVFIEAWNCDPGVAVNADVSIQVMPTLIDLQSVDLTIVTTGTLYTEEPVTFSADLFPDDASKPVTFDVDFGDDTQPLIGVSNDDPLFFTHTYQLPGDYSVLITAWNDGAVTVVTDTLDLTIYQPDVCVPLQGIDIQGAENGPPGVYTFTTVYTPSDASLPIEYTWDDDGTEAFSVRILSPGVYTLTVSASNCVTGRATDEHIIQIEAYQTYLPLIENGSAARGSFESPIVKSMISSVLLANLRYLLPTFLIGMALLPKARRM